MAKYDANELEEKAHWHELSEDELAEVIQRLNASLDDNDLCDTSALLEALGYAGAFTGLRPGFQELVEKFLVCPSNPCISATALGVLCFDWDLTGEYIDQIKSFIRCVEWDEGGTVQTTAIYVAGEYIRTIHNKEVLQCLFEVFINKDQPPDIRSNALQAISKAVGFDWHVMGAIDPDHFSENQIVKNIIARAQQMLSKKN